MLRALVTTWRGCTRRTAGLAVLLLLMLFDPTPRLAVAADAQPMRFDRIGRSDGLAQNAVMGIVQDSHGFMWLATESGLDRYDGYNFTHYRSDRASANSLPNDFVLALDVDSSGNVWAATDGGGIAMWRQDIGDFQVFKHDPDNINSLADNNVRTLLWDPRGYVWIGTLRHGLDRYDVKSGTFTHYRFDKNDPTSISNDEIYALTLSDKGIWVGTNEGLNHLDVQSGEFTRYGSDDSTAGLSNQQIRSMLIDSGGVLWVGTHQGGLNRFRSKDNSFVPYRHSADDPGSLSNDRVEVIFEDNQNRLWIGTADGLNLMDRPAESFVKYRHQPEDPMSLSGNFIISMFQDQGGLLWIGTKINGISKWNPRSWAFGHRRPGLEGNEDFRRNYVTSFTQDSKKRTYIGSFGAGLMMVDSNGEVMRDYRKGSLDSPLSDDRVMALLMTADDVLYVGTMAGGLNRIETTTGKQKVYRHDPSDPNSLAANGVMSLFEDSQGRIWVGTFGGGVSRLNADGDGFLNFPHRQDNALSLSSPRATTIAEDADGSIWVGTDAGGVNRLSHDESYWTHFLPDPDDINSLSDITVYTLHLDRRGILWAGTRSGLNRIVKGPQGAVRFEHVSQSEEISNSAIYGIRSDKEGNLWLSTSNGLSRYELTTGKVRDFHTGQGLQGEEFNVGAHYAAPDGQLFFGGSDGYNAFYPEDVLAETPPPVVSLVSLSMLNEPAVLGQPHERITAVDFGYTDDVITFEFAAMDYTAPTKNSYRYKLEGFDTDWVFSGNRHRATYTNLSGGEYMFKVQAANSDEVWSETGLDIHVQVDNPPWATWWAFVLYFLCFAGFIWSVWSAQQRKLAREAEYSRRLEAEVQARTAELADRNADLQIANAQLHEASHTDALTGLRNRRYFFEQVSKEIAKVPVELQADRRVPYNYGSDYVFIMVDLDHFKPVNDTHGHVAGDQMLLQVKEVLLNSCRSTDVVIRWGGDEFLVVARQASDEEACELVERIRANIAATVFSLGSGQVARTTTSIGFAAYPFLEDQRDLLSWEQVLKIADLAMYRSKDHRNAWTGISGVDFDGSADRLMEALHGDLDQLCDEGNIIIIESLKAAQEQTA